MVKFAYHLRLGSEDNERSIVYGHCMILSEESTYYPYNCFSHRFSKFSRRKCKCRFCLAERNHILNNRAITNNINIFSHLPYKSKKLTRPGNLSEDDVKRAYPELGINEEVAGI